MFMSLPTLPCSSMTPMASQTTVRFGGDLPISSILSPLIEFSSPRLLADLVPVGLSGDGDILCGKRTTSQTAQSSVDRGREPLAKDGTVSSRWACPPLISFGSKVLFLAAVVDIPPCPKGTTYSQCYKGLESPTRWMAHRLCVSGHFNFPPHVYVGELSRRHCRQASVIRG